ncbi:hypothetical protein P4O66_002260 [Electrophorus voltai]|uniref:Reverse transcriptase/retrotransposon-derived protein RNase H-like domain-containing protein n=1 Tax=Electrophorus voltai TaxID=2609070 RepID=A0AAD8YYY2_9TELE|nr:hypothetical protein P4O66_002260 [Electrophorus voltai]
MAYHGQETEGIHGGVACSPTVSFLIIRGQAKRLKWHPEAEGAFEGLKTGFSTAPVLQQPDPEKPFMVEVDALDVGAGAVLSQHRGKAGQLRPIAYYSKKLSPAETMGQPRDGMRDKPAGHSSFQDFSSGLPIEQGKGQHNVKAQSTNLEMVLSPSCFLAALKWDMNWEIEAANPQPHCPPNHLFIPSLTPQRPHDMVTLISGNRTSEVHPHGPTPELLVLVARHAWEDRKIHGMCRVCPQLTCAAHLQCYYV